MKIVCLRTGKTLVDKLSNTEASQLMLEKIKQETKHWTKENQEKVLNNYAKTGNHPFMFEVFV